MQNDQRSAIVDAVNCMNQSSQTIDSSHTVVKLVKETSNLDVNNKLVREVLKQDLKLSFLKSKKLHP